MNDDEPEELSHELVEQYERHLRGQGPKPDLSTVNPGLRVKIERMFPLLEAIAGMSEDLVARPARDRIATRLGLAGTARRSGGDRGSREIIDVLRQFEGPGARLSVWDDAVADAWAGGLLPALAVYRRLGLVIRVCQSGVPAEELAGVEQLNRARMVFELRPDTTAIALVADDGEMTSVIVTPEECRDAYDPARGQVGPSTTALPLPLPLALQRHLEFIDPAWDDLPIGLAHAPRFDISVSAVAAEQALTQVASAGTRTAEKGEALRSLGDREKQWLAALPSRIVDRELVPASLAAEIDDLAEALA